MNKIIGLVGKKASGKGTIVEIIKEILNEKTIYHTRFSDILSETLELWDIPATRENLQKLPVAMSKYFGDGILSKAVRNRISKIPADIVILDGIRWPSDYTLLRSFSANYLLYIDASKETRYKRMRRNKKGKVGENMITWEKFLEEEKAPSEIHIDKIGKQADQIILNEKDDNFSNLKIQVKEFCDLFL